MAISNDVLNSINGSSAATGGGSSNANGATAADTQDRFLKLLVAQLNNQDPMNPMDNAQMTTQIAQINTVTGIEKLNTTITGMAVQVAAMQAMQSTSMVGRDVLVEGNKAQVTDGVGRGGFELTSKTSATVVEVFNAAGKSVGKIDMVALSPGRQSFQFDASGIAATDAANLTFKVTAANGADIVTTTALQRAKVTSLGSSPAGMTLQLQNHADVSYADVKAIL